MKTKNILFVCKHNMFRSKIADAYFRKINKNKKIKVSSAGIIKGFYPLNKNEVELAKEMGINMVGNPRGLSIELVKKQNLIVIVADDVPREIFDRKEYINFKTTKIVEWKVQDEPYADNFVKMKKIIKIIMKKVEELNQELEREK